MLPRDIILFAAASVLIAFGLAVFGDGDHTSTPIAHVRVNEAPSIKRVAPQQNVSRPEESIKAVAPTPKVSSAIIVERAEVSITPTTHVESKPIEQSAPPPPLVPVPAPVVTTTAPAVLPLPSQTMPAPISPSEPTPAVLPVVDQIKPIERPTFKATLVGVVIVDDKKTAVFRFPNAEDSVTITQGDKLDGWTVNSIDVDRVRVKSGLCEQTLYLAGEGPKEPKGDEP